MRMLRSLFSSSTRADVLSLLLNNPDEKFYVREIAKLLKKNPSGIKRELDNLERAGLMISERVANLKYFHANKDSELYSELKSLITKSLGLPGALKALLKTSGAKAAFIYGPYAEGEETDTVNLFVISEDPALEKEVKGLEKKFGCKMDIMLMDEEEYRARRKKRDAVLRRILSEKRLRLAGKI